MGYNNFNKMKFTNIRNNNNIEKKKVLLLGNDELKEISKNLIFI